MLFKHISIILAASKRVKHTILIIIPHILIQELVNRMCPKTQVETESVDFFYFSEYLSKNIVTEEKSFTVEHGTTNSILMQPQSSLSRSHEWKEEGPLVTK